LNRSTKRAAGVVALVSLAVGCAAVGATESTDKPTAESESSPAAEPAFNIDSPRQGSVVSDSPVKVSGHAPAGARVVQDISLGTDESTIATASGLWSLLVNLDEGANNLVFRLGDDELTETYLGLTLEPKPTPEPTSTPKQTPTVKPTPEPTPEPTPAPRSAKRIVEGALRVKYDELFRHSDKYVGKPVYFKGEVIQVLDGGDGTYDLRVNVTKGDYGFWDDTVYVTWKGERVLEDDIIQFVGISEGPYTYESTMGASITIPLIDATVYNQSYLSVIG
jgi:hypothetical protein